jgi:hypothetical protein
MSLYALKFVAAGMFAVSLLTATLLLRELLAWRRERSQKRETLK